MELDDDDCKMEFYVHCDGCDREIEFGWSHPDRGGRIWPVECEGFNPWKSWPDPRFKESWTKKNTNSLYCWKLKLELCPRFI